MRSKRITVNIPLDMYPALEHKMKKEGYPSVAAGLVAMGLYDIIIDRPHSATGGLYSFSLDEQDRMFQNASKNYFSGEAKEGSWHERTLEKIVEKAALREKIPPSRVGRQMLQMLADEEATKKKVAEDLGKSPRKKKET